jgi:hypothetical protein
MAAPVATLVGVSGPVLVDSGKGFVKVSSAADLNTGARVLVAKDGKAVLSYGNGCSLTLSPNSITSVTDGKACKEKSQVAAADLTYEPAPAPIVAPPPTNLAWLGFVAAAGAGGVIGWLIADSNNDDPGNTTVTNTKIIIVRPPPPISW